MSNIFKTPDLITQIRSVKRISEAQGWQILGMHTTGMFFKAIRRQMDYYYTVDW
jgi:hypothetical protein